MIFKYKSEEVEYSTEELLKLEDGETVAIDFNGKYMIEFKKDEKLGSLVTTGRGMDGRGSHISVEMLEVDIPYLTK